MIGNVWEWTSDDFRPEQILPADATLDVSLKSVHGGAYDTYFDNQATCQFQSGENVLARRHNIGVRLAIGVCDLALASASAADPNTQSSCPDSTAGDENLAAPAITTAADDISPDDISADDASEKVATEEVPV